MKAKNPTIHLARIRNVHKVVNVFEFEEVSVVSFMPQPL